MTTVQKSALVRFPAHLMFELVDDIASYPKFLPWCSASRILRRSGDVVDAELDVARGGFHKSFATRNTVVAPREIRMSLLSGPFEHLSGVWTFTPLRDDASKISLDLEFEMSGKLASLAFGAIFNQICNTMVTAFCDRAKALYIYHHEEDEN
ncbi:type II toxin-antitoxin system RatA family toxin [Methylococcus sp. EFPC2]|uniref:type II toxin-antitoxin system RatA family toxin n=1 Tax=Methylococcus sp. EFPC2 TaxID=2812648 RepID=UPI001967D336|nr:type II toxin-antitoxin system RatA family toxin [Methylococcus sp. EFPC2]QSA97615.1 type II toxin-antitoxin system RatA family toxin [Methylococcus sp. EFPC2]